ncbi:MAG TPA: DUF2066 domain-containing protein [Rhizomicrobium sp.]|jgi:hypothetical protein
MRRLIPLAAAALVSLMSLAAAPPAKKPLPHPAPAKAQPASVAPAQPAPMKGDPFSVSVSVDASAASASVAQNIAINGGRAAAWTQVSHRLVPQKSWDRLPKLDDTQLQRLVSGYTTSGERRSTTRYTARVTYVFNPGAVRHVLRVSNIAFADQAGSAILVVALSPTYGAHLPWAMVWAQPKYSTAQYPLVTPIGDVVDQSQLGSLRLSDASWADVEPVASRVHANEAVLVQASNPAAAHMTIKMRRIGPGRAFSLPDVDVPLPPAAPPQKAYAMAADLAAAAIEDAWKTRVAIDFNKKSRLAAEVRIVSLEQWSELLARLATVPAISDVNVSAMNIGEARLSITYAGGPDQLRELAAQSNLNFSNRDGVWWLSAGRQPSPAPDDE